MPRAALLLILWLLAPVFAQETDPNIDFVTAVMRRVLTGDGPGAAQLITADQPRALESFQLLVNGYPMIKDPKQQLMLKGYVNTVARVFEANGDPSLVQRLKAEGLLVEQPSPQSDGSHDALRDLSGLQTPFVVIGDWR